LALQQAIDQTPPSLDDMDPSDPRHRPLEEYYKFLPTSKRPLLVWDLEDWVASTTLTLSQVARAFSLMSQLLRDAAGANQEAIGEILPAV